MLGYFMFFALFGVLLYVVYAEAFPELEVAYPKVVESRRLTSEKVLHIKDGLTLQLEKASVLSENFVLTDSSSGKSVVTLMNGKVLEQTLYHDKKNMAVVQIIDKNGTVEVRGIVGERLRIIPLPLVARSGNGPIAHKLFQIESSAHYGDDYIVSSNPPPEARSPLATPKRAQNNTKIPDPFLVELKIVVDGYHFRHFSTVEEEILYMATTIAVVNLRYQNTKNPRVFFLITEVMVGSTSTLWTISGVDPDDPGNPYQLYTSSKETLPRFANRYQYETADIVLLVTGLKLADLINGTITTRVKGLAYLEGLCLPRYRFGQMEDVPHTYSGVPIAAHELGHLMGMHHDGDVPSSNVSGTPWLRCSPKAGYIMAPYTGGDNDGFFSKCSLQQMNHFLTTISEDCFKVKSQTDINSPKLLPGKRMNMTDICRKRFRHISGMTGFPKSGFTENCKFLCCPNYGGGRVSCFVQPLVDGMSCGSNKICKRGRCGNHSAKLPPQPTLPRTSTTTGKLTKLWRP
uniref:Putative secreted metalloprotease n=1 Tax=Ixodes ricinus TaxID=34613 RepID=A0A147BX07_IXORI